MDGGDNLSSGESLARFPPAYIKIIVDSNLKSGLIYSRSIVIFNISYTKYLKAFLFVYFFIYLNYVETTGEITITFMNSFNKIYNIFYNIFFPIMKLLIFLLNMIVTNKISKRTRFSLLKREKPQISICITLCTL